MFRDSCADSGSPDTAIWRPATVLPHRASQGRRCHGGVRAVGSGAWHSALPAGRPTARTRVAGSSVTTCTRQGLHERIPPAVAVGVSTVSSGFGTQASYCAGESAMLSVAPVIRGGDDRVRMITPLPSHAPRRRADLSRHRVAPALLGHPHSIGLATVTDRRLARSLVYPAPHPVVTHRSWGRQDGRPGPSRSVPVRVLARPAHVRHTTRTLTGR